MTGGKRVDGPRIEGSFLDCKFQFDKLCASPHAHILSSTWVRHHTLPFTRISMVHTLMVKGQRKKISNDNLYTAVLNFKRCSVAL